MRRGFDLGFALLLAASARRTRETYPSKTIRVIIPFRRRQRDRRHSAHRVRSALAPARAGHRGGRSRRRRRHDRLDRRRQGRIRMGYTLLVNSSAHTITARRIYANLRMDSSSSDLPPTAPAPSGSVPNVLTSPPLPKGLKTLGEFVTPAKARPGSFNFASVGVGSAVASERRSAFASRPATRPCIFPSRRTPRR